MLRIDQATADDVRTLAARITPADAAELEAAGQTVESALDGVDAQALRNGDALVCLFGAQPHPDAPGLGIPWMLCTVELHDVPKRAMAAVSAKVVKGWRARFPVLFNCVHRSNESAIRFVEWLGFTVTHEPAGPGGQFFVFKWERRDV
jgi:hypothetical protein